MSEGYFLAVRGYFWGSNRRMQGYPYGPIKYVKSWIYTPRGEKNPPEGTFSPSDEFFTVRGGFLAVGGGFFALGEQKHPPIECIFLNKPPLLTFSARRGDFSRPRGDFSRPGGFFPLRGVFFPLGGYFHPSGGIFAPRGVFSPQPDIPGYPAGSNENH